MINRLVSCSVSWVRTRNTERNTQPNFKKAEKGFCIDKSIVVYVFTFTKVMHS